MYYAEHQHLLGCCWVEKGFFSLFGGGGCFLPENSIGEQKSIFLLYLYFQQQKIGFSTLLFTYAV